MILLVEDSNYLKDFAANLSWYGFDVGCADNVTDAIYHIEYEPGYLAYEGIILDLHLPIKGFSGEALEEAKRVFGGWAFYKHILGPYSDLQERTVFLTGFGDELEDILGHTEYKRLNIINKNDTDQLKKIVKLLRRFSFH